MKRQKFSKKFSKNPQKAPYLATFNRQSIKAKLLPRPSICIRCCASFSSKTILHSSYPRTDEAFFPWVRLLVLSMMHVAHQVLNKRQWKADTWRIKALKSLNIFCDLKKEVAAFDNSITRFFPQRRYWRMTENMITRYRSVRFAL